jgi:hypothetical protein
MYLRALQSGSVGDVVHIIYGCGMLASCAALLHFQTDNNGIKLGVLKNVVRDILIIDDYLSQRFYLFTKEMNRNVAYSDFPFTTIIISHGND